MKCPKCVVDPEAHSFVKLGTLTNGTHLYYTCPFDAKDKKDGPDMVHYIQLHLNEVKQQNWIWIFDCYKFGEEQATSMQTAMAITKILEDDHQGYLKKIYIVNSAWHFHALLRLCLPFLKKSSKEKIKDVSGDAFQTIVFLEKEGIPVHFLQKLRHK